MKLNRIRAVLEDKGISQTWLAKKLGRSFSTVNAYVCNRTQPNLTTLLEIAQLLSVDMKELIMAKTEHSHPLGMVVSTHFRCGKGVKRGLKNGALPFNID